LFYLKEDNIKKVLEKNFAKSVVETLMILVRLRPRSTKARFLILAYGAVTE